MTVVHHVLPVSEVRVSVEGVPIAVSNVSSVPDGHLALLSPSMQPGLLPR